MSELRLWQFSPVKKNTFDIDFEIGIGFTQNTPFAKLIIFLDFAVERLHYISFYPEEHHLRKKKLKIKLGYTFISIFGIHLSHCTYMRKIHFHLNTLSGFGIYQRRKYILEAKKGEQRNLKFQIFIEQLYQEEKEKNPIFTNSTLRYSQSTSHNFRLLSICLSPLGNPASWWTGDLWSKSVWEGPASRPHLTLL